MPIWHCLGYNIQYTIEYLEKRRRTNYMYETCLGSNKLRNSLNHDYHVFKVEGYRLPITTKIMEDLYDHCDEHFTMKYIHSNSFS